MVRRTYFLTFAIELANRDLDNPLKPIVPSKIAFGFDRKELEFEEIRWDSQ